MHSWLADLLIIWHLGLVLVLAISALRARRTLRRGIAVSALGPLVTSVLALLAAARADAVYLDIALVIAMLGVAQTLITVQTAEKHEELR